MGLFVREIAGEATYSSFVMNLSSGGILLERPSTAAPRPAPCSSRSACPTTMGGWTPTPSGAWHRWSMTSSAWDDPAEASGWRRSALRFSAMADAHRERLETWFANQRGGERWEDLGQGVRVLRPG